MPEHIVITIGRQLGSGGRQIGLKLAERMNLAFYDKELLQIASRESGIGREFFERMDEQESYSIFPGLPGLKGSVFEEAYGNYYLSNERLFKIQSDVIRQLAEEKPCLFVGRCADYILKDHPLCLKIFISADWADRIKRISEIYEFTAQKSKEFIEKYDKKRAAYYNYFTSKKWGFAASYDLCINSSILGIDETVRFIQRFAETMYPKNF